MTLGTELSSPMIKPDLMQKIKAALGLKDKDEVSPDKIKEAQKKNKMKETGKLDVMTLLALLKGPTPAKEPEKVQPEKEASEVETLPVTSQPTNESYYLNEADGASGGLSIVKLINSAQKKIVSSVNDQLNKEVNSKSPWKETYEIDLLLTTKEFTFSIGYNVKMTSFKAESASFKPSKEQNMKGWYLAKAAGKAAGSVYVDLGWVKYNVDINAAFSLDAWVKDFTKPDGIVQINPPKLNVSTSPIDVGIGYLSIRDNKLVLKNALFGEFDFDLPIQSSIDKCFDPVKGGPYITTVKKLEEGKF